MTDKPNQIELVHGVPPMAISQMTTRVNKTGSWKYIRPIYQDKVAPCNEGCPVGIDIEAYMHLLQEGQAEAAQALLLRENPMPATTGRVCYHPCESACNRRRYDDAVSIHAVERALGDQILKAPLPEPAPRRHDERIAIVGSGPTGLACAYHLARLGYGVTIFEAAPEPGGILRLGIPEYRLPKALLAREIERIAALGVEIRCGVRVGVDLPASALDEYDAVFVATGVHESGALRIPGEDAAGLRAGLAFLREMAFGDRPELGGQVIVVGGGNTAMDCARTALRLGAEQVTVLYRRTQAEMPANDEEREEAEAEGVAFRFLAAPVGVRTDDAGGLVGLECVKMKLGEVDASGRRRPVPVEGSAFFLPATTVLKAIGEAPAFEALPEGVEHDRWAVGVDALGRTSRDRVFAGGDLIDQPHTVADALGSGKRAALGIDRQLRERHLEASIDPLRYGELGNVSMTRWRGDDPVHRNGAVNAVVRFEQLNMDHFVKAPRHADRHAADRHAAGGAGFGEVNQGLDGASALAEAARCFNCGVCNRCEICLIFCPDVSIARRPDGTGFDIDYDYCKGCGLCSAECPRGAMAMTREGL